MVNIWQTLIKCILHIPPSMPPLSNTGIGGGRVVSTTLLKLPENCVIYIECLLMEKTF